ncbi:MAG TPA: DJ-1/PfpI family protein [Bacteroidales bacterium]|nr:DJ-1/PfpI family protein [Bacteroidales bacterium]
MKKLTLLMIIPIILLSFKAETPKVLMFIQDNSYDTGYMLKNEAGLMKQILQESGFTVEIATLSGELLNSDSISIQPDLKLSEANVKNYAGFIIPCMAAKDTVITPEERRFVKSITEQNKPLAAETGAVLILAKAGLLKGKKYAFVESYVNQWKTDFEGAIFSGEGVIRDGNIMTSGICPMQTKMYGKANGTAELTKMLVEAMKAEK